MIKLKFCLLLLENYKNEILTFLLDVNLWIISFGPFGYLKLARSHSRFCKIHKKAFVTYNIMSLFIQCAFVQPKVLEYKQRKYIFIQARQFWLIVSFLLDSNQTTKVYEFKSSLQNKKIYIFNEKLYEFDIFKHCRQQLFKRLKKLAMAEKALWLCHCFYFFIRIYLGFGCDWSVKIVPGLLLNGLLSIQNCNINVSVYKRMVVRNFPLKIVPKTFLIPEGDSCFLLWKVGKGTTNLFQILLFRRMSLPPISNLFTVCVISGKNENVLFKFLRNSTTGLFFFYGIFSESVGIHKNLTRTRVVNSYTLKSLNLWKCQTYCSDY